MMGSLASMLVVMQSQAAPSVLVQLFPIILIFGIFYLLVIAPSRKRQKALQGTIDALKKGDRDVLQGVCGRFLALLASWAEAPRPAGVRKRLEEVHSDAVRMMKTIHALHDADASDKTTRQAAVALLHAAAPGNDWAALDDDLYEFSERLATLGKAANDAISNLPADRGGNPGDFPLETLVSRLVPIFTDITGQQPTITYDDMRETYGGPFLIFVEAFLNPVAPYYQKSNLALGKSVQY